jgi:hypothetical protein
MSEKIYNKNIHSHLNLTSRSDEIAGLDYGSYRALLSCGHACDPNSLTEWCRSILNDGSFKFTCPALIEGRKCDQDWSYDEVRRLALLTQEEKLEFEAKLNEIYAKSVYLKQCPKCECYTQKEIESKKIECLNCKKSGICFRFCWECDQEWLDLSSSERCGNYSCSNKELDALKNCIFISLPGCPGLGQIPSLRACPTCGKLVEHNGQGCKNIICKQCKVEFCFACMETTIECQRLKGGHNAVCVKPVAPIQTCIPKTSF